LEEYNLLVLTLSWWVERGWRFEILYSESGLSRIDTPILEKEVVHKAPQKHYYPFISLFFIFVVPILAIIVIFTSILWNSNGQDTGNYIFAAFAISFVALASFGWIPIAIWAIIYVVWFFRQGRDHNNNT
jgi:hypothetical protein